MSNVREHRRTLAALVGTLGLAMVVFVPVPSLGFFAGLALLALSFAAFVMAGADR